MLLILSAYKATSSVILRSNNKALTYGNTESKLADGRLGGF
jgi:hypothetical protein